MAAGTITFGECAENHAGMQKLGAAGATGLTFVDLVRAKDRLTALGARCELIDLVSEGGVEELMPEPEPAEVLVIRGGLAALLAAGGRAGAAVDADDFEAEHGALEPDKRALMRGRVVNKLARWNLCFADHEQEPAYAEGKGRVVKFADVPLTSAVRDMLPRVFGPKARGLYAEGNYYYNVLKCGIGFHGDSERRIVIAARFGAAFPLHYQWFHRGGPVGERIRIALNHGDMYAMSWKAVGSDWKRPSIPTLRHAAGAEKYLAIAAR